MKRIILSVAMLMLGASLLSAQTLKVVSYNIRLGVANDKENSWQFRKEATPAMINEIKPDIMGLQEAYDFQEQYIQDNARSYKLVSVARDDGKEKGERMSIVWNDDTVELLDWGTFWLSETPDEPSLGWDAACRRTATWAFMKLRKSGKRFFYVNTHLDHIGVEARRNGLALVEKKIADMNPENLPMVLTGDFNIRRDNPTIVEFNERMNNARECAAKTDSKASYNGWGKSDTDNIIDYIYFKGFRKCLSFQTLDQSFAGKPYISDHYPVCAVLKF